MPTLQPKQTMQTVQRLQSVQSAQSVELAKVSDKLALCEKRQIATFTDFYAPINWAAFVATFAETKKTTKILTFGGTADSERRIIGFFPAADYANDYDYYPNEPNNADNSNTLLETFPIKIIQIKHNTKFNKPPRHQDYLGAIIGLGLERTKIGDILIADFAEIFVYSDIADYICLQLDKVGNTAVTAAISPKSGITASLQKKSVQINLASMRLDVALCAIFKLSRTQVSALIASEKAFINWLPCKVQSKTLATGDIITLRGYGRAEIGEILGTTKKDRLRVQVFL